MPVTYGSWDGRGKCSQLRLHFDDDRSNFEDAPRIPQPLR
jgi:hypothetical protein